MTGACTIDTDADRRTRAKVEVGADDGGRDLGLQLESRTKRQRTGDEEA
jgi:hypothetical protein